ncbi:hypothetical protein SERLADRAFT_471561 [Serpula lacrymans var. lacrymans S7.9]|uniref:CP-type G domain-containing protein n=1 Tax=Serpula lacrymans var. lacrymans (strain S7.9) TaxID=578457 RepID=F8P1E5_SERL9|nr:uncharacterized protein SERLADRAFT_471561 [Serpula lacrymans var. lacrymans S7.9]EGO22974.1 hypothetical protein SERLADRAFT_471561 [Serpula lacrymans var. lacrymans S7.9]
MTMGKNKSRKTTVPLKSKLKKDPGVPRLPDLKVRVRNAEKQRAHPQIHRTDPDAQMASEPTLSTLAMIASSSETQDSTVDPSSSAQKTKEQIRRHYVRTLHKVIDESDIVILVLDAEEEVRRRESEGKKLVFVLNKIDLVPRDNAQQWLRHLRHSTPTLPFRSASNTQRSNLSSSTAPGLIRLLKAYKPSAAQSVTVGVVGFPNVGKSSLINSLKRSKVCAVAAQPGHTKDLQSIQLERGIRIVDSPGVVFDDDDEVQKSGSKGSILLRNVVKVEDVEDPIAVVEDILARTNPDTIQKIYGLPQFTSTLEFLTMLALSSGRLLKGGTPDVLSAAKHVLMDWNHQKIPYFSVPPSVHPSSIPSTVTISGDATIAPGAETVGQAQILAEFGKPFELAGFFGAADAGAFGEDPAVEEVVMDEDHAIEEATMMDEDSIPMESDDLTPRIPRKRARSPSVVGDPQRPLIALKRSNDTSARAPKRLRKAKDLSAYDEAAPRGNSLSRKTLKKDAKRARRDASRAFRAHGEGVGGGPGMEVDDLQFTFMAQMEG